MPVWKEVLPQLKLIVGLGNVGEKYDLTRHNAGFIFVDYLQQNYQGSNWSNETKFKGFISEVTLDAKKLLLLKPTTFMNSSGEAIQLVLNYYHIKPEEILVAHDDLDIKLGKFKVQWANGPRVHNGITSVNHNLKTEDYWRLRLGIENREQAGNKSVPGMRFALERFQPEELTIIQNVCHEITTTI
jgi:peptidyl-tRNA hydrolase, PTH1 family